MIGSLFLMAARLWCGARSLARQFAVWLAAGELTGRTRAGAILGRVLGGVVAGWFVGGLLYASGLLWWGSSAIVLLSAWVAGRPGRVESQPEGLDPAVFLELLHDLSDGRNLHLSEVRAQLAEEFPGTDWHGPATRALCDAAGVRVRDGVRVPGASPAVTTGIHRDDLPPLPHPSPLTPVGDVAAGEGDNNNSNTRTEVGADGVAWINKTGPSIRQEARR